MRRVTKRLLVSLLVCAMVAACLPVAALATGDDDRWQNRGVSSPSDTGGGPQVDVGPVVKDAADPSSCGAGADSAGRDPESKARPAETTAVWAAMCTARILSLRILSSTALLR